MTPSKSQEAKSNKWDAEFRRQHKAQQYPKWPNEAMVKMLFGSGNYLKKPFKPKSSWTVLDIGCGFANNLLPFLDIGCDCHGIDLHEGIVKNVKKIMQERGYELTLSVGSNSSIPYQDDSFDLLISLNTLHYEGTEQKVLAALNEFKRVLKPGGGLYISTVGPKHDIYTKAKPLLNHRYEVANYDFRDGQKFFFFDNERYLNYYCQMVFDDVEIGRVTEKMPNFNLDFLTALCRQ